MPLGSLVVASEFAYRGKRKVVQGRNIKMSPDKTVAAAYTDMLNCGGT